MLSLPGGWIADRLIGTQAAVLWGGVHHRARPPAAGLSRHAAVGVLSSAWWSSCSAPACSSPMSARWWRSCIPKAATGAMPASPSTTWASISAPSSAADRRGWLAQHYGWHCGFLSAAVGMVLGVAYSWLRRAPGRGRPDPLAAQGDAPRPGSASARAALARRHRARGRAAVALVWSGVVAGRARRAAGRHHLGDRRRCRWRTSSTCSSSPG